MSRCYVGTLNLMMAMLLVFSCARVRAQQPDDLVAHYAFDEGTGTVAHDTSAARYDATIQGARWVEAFGGHALDFDGASAFVDCGPGSRLNLQDRFSISVLIHPRGAPSGEPVIVGEGPSYWGMTHYRGFVYLYVKSPDKWNSCRAPVPYHEWSHVVGTYDGNALRIYVNGSLSASQTLPAPTRIRSGVKLRMGGGNEKNAFYNGLLDDVRIYSRALADDEIAEMSARALPGRQVTAPSPEERRTGEAFFREHPEPLAFRESGSQLWFASRTLGIEIIRGQRGLRLSRLHDVAANLDFLAEDTPRSAEGFWQIVLRRDRGRDTTDAIVTSTQDADVSWRLERSPSEATLLLRWGGLAVADQAGVLDVEVCVTLRENDPLSRWRIRVTNRSETYGLWEVVFPALSLAPIGGRAETNSFAIGRGRGIVVRDPFHDANRYSFGFGANYGCYWPGTLNMQFQALYDDSGNGLYLAVHDGSVNRKVYTFTPHPEPATLEWKVGHFPENMGFPAEDYEMSYDVLIGPFRGDWYDACQIYRAWAVQQQWCRLGPLAVRQDVPRWFKECPLMFVTLFPPEDRWVAQSRDRMLRYLRFFETELPVVWYTWRQYFPDKTEYNKPGSPWQVPEKRPYPVSNIHDGNYPAMPALESFSAACKAISDAGGHVLPYVCSSQFDPGIGENAPLAAEAKPNAARAPDGEIMLGEDGKLVWQMCPHTPWWQKRMAETITELIRREHASGVYFDTFYGGNYRTAQCFDTSHGHSHGGGTSPYLGDRNLSAAARGAMKRADPQAVMTGESPAESAIDLLDGFLYRWTVWPDMAPLFATVYGDYVVRYGASLSPASDGFYIQCATLFTEGAQMGRLHLHENDYLEDFDAGSRYTEKMRFLRSLARRWKPESGGKYLAYGRLLRPLKFRSPSPVPMASYTETTTEYREGVISVPVLQSGVFALDDANIGIFIVNVGQAPVDYRFDMTPGDYPIRPDTTYRVRRVGETGDTLDETRVEGRIAHAGEIAPHEAVFVEATPSAN